MALKRRNKANPAFSMSSMTDIVFLLLIFFMITSTMVHPTAIKMLLPKASTQTSAKPYTTVSLNHNLQYYIQDKKVSFVQLERELAQIVKQDPETYIALHIDKRVSHGEAVKLYELCQRNKYKVIVATSGK